MKNSMQGFTLIELVLVIVLVSILAVYVTEKYFDYSEQAYLSTTTNIAGALASASTLNSVMRNVDNTKGVVVSDCADAANLLQNGLPSGYTISAAAMSSGSNVCTLSAPSATSVVVSFYAEYAG